MRRKKNSEIGVRIGRMLLTVLACCGIAPCAFGQSQPDGGSAGPSPKAMLVDGEPALGLDYGDGMGFLIVYSKFHDKSAFRFSVAHWKAVGFPSHDYNCGGFLWITMEEIAYSPDPVNPAAKQLCARASEGSAGAFDLSRTEFTKLNFYDAGYDFFGIALEVSQATPTMNKDGFHGAYFVYRDSTNGKAYNWKDNRVNTEIKTAGRIAGHWLQVAFNNFPDAEKQFMQTTAAISVPLSPTQLSELRSAGLTIDAAIAAGSLKDAFNRDIAALSNVPLNASGVEVDVLRQRLFTLAGKINPAPTVPEEAKRHLAYALAAITDWKSSGDVNKLTEADDELNQVARLAPWRPEVYYNLGIVLEGQNQYGAAARNLKFYMQAAPSAPDADAVQQKIYQLEYKAGAR